MGKGKERKGKGEEKAEEVEGKIWNTQNFGVAPPMIRNVVCRLLYLIFNK